MPDDNKNISDDRVSRNTLIIYMLITLFVTVGILEFSGKIKHSSDKTDLELSTYKVVYIPKAEVYRVSRKPSNQTAVCIDNYLFIKSDTDTTLQGILIDYKNRGVRCRSKSF
jgi:hypothetical protein